MEKGSQSRSCNRSCFPAALFLASSLAVACSSSSSKPTTVATTATPPATVLPAALPDLPPPPPMREVAPTAPRSVKVLSDGHEGNPQPSLIEASRMAKAKKRDDGQARPVIEITDENLRDFSSGGQVFVLETGATTGTEQVTVPPVESSAVENSAPKASSMPRATAAVEGADQELFWRQSVAGLRKTLRQAVDDLRRIELESTMLRQQFYSESDPFVRDSEIKPRWDRALDQLSTLRKKAKDDQNALASLLTEARKSGVSSEWLQEDSALELTAEDSRLIDGPRGQQ